MANIFVQSNQVAVNNTYNVHEGQSLFDVAIQLGYSIDNIISLCQENEIGLNEQLKANQQLLFVQQNILNVPFAKFVNKKGITLNTSTPKVVSGASFSKSFSKSFDTK